MIEEISAQAFWQEFALTADNQAMNYLLLKFPVLPNNCETKEMIGVALVDEILKANGASAAQRGDVIKWAKPIFLTALFALIELIGARKPEPEKSEDQRVS